MKTACVIVIGHVDHGKTALVRALTGMETDRLAQEKQRGLSITLGFAHCTTPSGTLDLIDAPGHADFTRAMVAGASGAHAAMLVVSAVDGVAPQTLDHLRIAEILGVPVRVIAVTKADLVPSGDLPARLAEIGQTLASCGVKNASLVACSAQSVPGTRDLLTALQTVLAQDAPTGPLAAFLPIDRVFSAQGMGTVVTGTLLGGTLKAEDSLTLNPQGLPVAIRGLQNHGSASSCARKGMRTAVNLRGIAVEDIARGDVLCATEAFAPSTCFSVLVRVLPDAPRPVKHMQDHRVLFGTASEVATLRLMGGGQLAPGQSGYAQLRFKRPVCGFAGQRAVLRALSPALTVGGVEILDPLARPEKSGDAAALALMQATETQDISMIGAALCELGHGGAAIGDLARLARQTRAEADAFSKASFVLLRGDIFAPHKTIRTVQSDILATLDRFHANHPIKPFAPRHLLDNLRMRQELIDHVLNSLSAQNLLRISENQLAVATHDPWAQITPRQQATLNQIEAALRSGGITPPDITALAQGDEGADLVALLVAAGRVLPLSNVALKQRLLFHADALAKARHLLEKAFPKPDWFTTSQARAALDTTRKFIVPLLEHFDAMGITLREGDTRRLA